MPATLQTPPAVSPRDQSYEGYVVIEDASWQLYELLLRDIGEQNLRITFDGGRLVLMSPRRMHELVKSLIGFFVELTAMELDLPCARFGSTTWKRKDFAIGLEADECYYLANASRIGVSEEVDLNKDPPPDLAVEVEITHHPIDRLSVYARLGVAELWRYESNQIRLYRRDAEGAYQPIERSVAMPLLTASVLNEHLSMLEESVMEHVIVRRFRDWLRAQPEIRDRS